MGLLRLFLALSVLVGHTRHHLFGLPLINRETALQSFFVISGFYMALVLNEKYTAPGWGCYWTFIQQRFLRLYPTYLIILGLILLVDGIVYLCTGTFWGSLQRWHAYAPFASPQALAFMVGENLLIFGQDAVLLLRLDPTTGSFCLNPSVPPVTGASSFLLNIPAWSLAVELSFYLLAPFLVRRSPRAQVGIFLACAALRMTMFWAIPHDSYHWVYFLFWPNLFFFMAGSLGYLVYKNYGARLRQLALTRRWIIGIFALIALAYAGLPFAHHLYWIWFPMFFGMVPMLFSLTCKNRTDRLLGELSYPFYLIHSHVLMLTIPLYAPHRYQWMTAPVSAILTLSLSYFFYQFIERRTERYRENLYRKSHSVLPVTEPALVL